eukprot:GHVS01102071.1.p1 GENE.GHVS01102071.1~~GHVS01102071.1.p1  ORF type:complete len:115 (+),score=4.85 GHVS01102071.1:1186-1530(+)
MKLLDPSGRTRWWKFTAPKKLRHSSLDLGASRFYVQATAQKALEDLTQPGDQRSFSPRSMTLGSAAGKFFNPRGRTLHSKRPKGVMKAVAALEPSITASWTISPRWGKGVNVDY